MDDDTLLEVEHLITIVVVSALSRHYTRDASSSSKSALTSIYFVRNALYCKYIVIHLCWETVKRNKLQRINRVSLMELQPNGLCHIYITCHKYVFLTVVTA